MADVNKNIIDAYRSMYESKEEVLDETNKNDKSDDGDGLDAVQPKAVKKKFDDRKDKDIDNDGDVDSSDKFLHKRRKAVSKAMEKELNKMCTPSSTNRLFRAISNSIVDYTLLGE